MDDLNRNEGVRSEKMSDGYMEEVPEEMTQKQVDSEAEEAKTDDEKDDCVSTVVDNTVGKLICPRCGKTFDPKEKQCPYCGLKNDLKICPTCGTTMAKSAKQCPKCGAKNKKPFYKAVWFWIVIAVVVLIIIFNLPSDKGETTIESTPNETSSAQEQAISEKTSTSAVENPDETAVVGTWTGIYIIDLDDKKTSDLDKLGISTVVEFNADHTGTMTSTGSGSTDFTWSYTRSTDDGDILYTIGGTKAAIIGHGNEMSEYEGDLMMYTDSTVILLEYSGASGTSKSSASTSRTNSVDSSMTSSQKNALKKAESYLKYSAFSYTSLIDQLEYEGYSTEDATYAVNHCGADWKEQAVKKAESYLKYSAFSKSGLIEQLEYEGFTHEQAVYGADQAY